MRNPTNIDRVRDGDYASSAQSTGNNGKFIIPHKRISDYFFQVLISDGMGWEHASVSLVRKVVEKKKSREGGRKVIRTKTVWKEVDRCPTWEEMCWIKDRFWKDDETVVQYHPAKQDWVSNHPYCLHLWKPTDQVLPSPASIMVGLTELNSEEHNMALNDADNLPPVG